MRKKNSKTTTPARKRTSDSVNAKHSVLVGVGQVQKLALSINTYTAGLADLGATHAADQCCGDHATIRYRYKCRENREERVRRIRMEIKARIHRERDRDAQHTRTRTRGVDERGQVLGQRRGHAIGGTST